MDELASDLRKRLVEIARRLETLQGRDRRGAERTEYLSLAQEQDVIVAKLRTLRGN